MLMAALAFIAIFSLSALLLSLAGAETAEVRKQALARLAAMTMAASASSETPVDLRKRESMSSIPLLNRLLGQAELAPRLRDLLSQAALDWTPARLLLLCACCCFVPAYLVYLRTDSGILSAAMGAVGGAGPLMYVLYRRRKRFDQFEQGLPSALDLVVSGLRSGHSLISAMSLVTKETPDPIGREFRICFDEQNYGLELRTAMHNLTRRVPIQDVRIVVTAILIQKETGGNLAEVLDRCSQVIRERFRLKKEIQVKTAQARMTGMILTLLPLILGVLLYLANPSHMRLLWTRPLGLKMLYGSCVLTVLGGLLIRKIVRIRV